MADPVADPRRVPCPKCLSTNRVPPERFADRPVCGRCQARLLPAQPVDLDDESFDKYVRRSDLPVVVDCWATWCGPCKVMAPEFARVASSSERPTLFAKLETDRAPRTAERLGIRSIPTLVLFRGGREIARKSGALRAPAIAAWLAQNGA